MPRSRLVVVIAAAAATMLILALLGLQALRPEEPAAVSTPQLNPFAGHALWAAPYPAADDAVAALRAAGQRAQADRVARLAQQPRGLWLDNPAAEPGPLRDYVADLTRTALAGGQVPVFVIYGIPHRDVTEGGNGGARDGATYRGWVDTIAAGIIAGRSEAGAASGAGATGGGGAAARSTAPGTAVILEPDALAQLDQLPRAEQPTRLALLDDAVGRLAAIPGVGVYVDAGHSDWLPAPVMAERLARVGVSRARGFALNVSNYGATADQRSYGTRLAGLLGGKHYVIDTSRNGAGPDPGGQWCNPPGRRVGAIPDPRGDGDLDATLWVKPPAESDGVCAPGQPVAGTFWTARAVELTSGW